MREAISIYGDKEHITEVNKTYVFFTFPDGSQDRKKSRKQDLQEVFEWVKGELYFYNRMYEEAKQMYESEKEKFDKIRHYYSDEEIHEACLKNRFASIDMGISNEKYKEDWHRISGKWSVASKANDRYWKLYKLAEQIKSAISLM